MARFVSPHANLRLFGGPLGPVRFVAGTYETAHSEEERWLRAHRGFGVDFYEEGKAAPRQEPDDPRILKARLAAAEAQIRTLTERLAAYEAAAQAPAEPLPGDPEVGPGPETGEEQADGTDRPSRRRRAAGGEGR